MECQFFQWLFAGAGPTSLQHALVGVGCLLAFDATSRWWKGKKLAAKSNERDVPEAGEGTVEHRRAA